MRSRPQISGLVVGFGLLSAVGMGACGGDDPTTARPSEPRSGLSDAQPPSTSASSGDESDAVVPEPDPSTRGTERNSSGWASETRTIQAVRGDYHGPLPPAPHIRVDRVGDEMIVAYRFDRLPSAGAIRPVALLVSARSASEDLPPLTESHRIKDATGQVRQRIGLGDEPFEVLVSALAAKGLRSDIVLAPLPAK